MAFNIFNEVKKKEAVWDIKAVGLAVDSEAGRGRCTRRYARNAKKNAKSLLSQEKIVRYIARIVSQSVKTAAAR